MKSSAIVPRAGVGASTRLNRHVVGGVLTAVLLTCDPSRGSAQVPGPVVWTMPSLARVGEQSPAQGSSSVELWAARGESESFQIVVRPSTAPLRNVNVVVSDLVGANSARILSSAIALYREHYVTVSKASPDPWGSNRPLGAGRYADALIPFVDAETGRAPASGTMRAVPFSVETGFNQPVWVDIEVPRTAESGRYEGTFLITSDQGTATGTIVLHVWNFSIPIKPALKSSFPFGNGDSGTLAQNKELLRNRLSPISVNVADERALLDSGGLTARSLGFWADANHAQCSTMSAPPSVAEIQARVALHQPDLFLYNYTADEIGTCTSLFPDVKAWARNLHAAGVPNLITMAPTSALLDDGSGTGRSAVDIWVGLPWLLDRQTPDVAVAIGKGDQVWSYNALSQDDYSPKWLMDYPPINFRLQPGLISQSLHLTGLLYWKVDRWTQDPWNDVNNTGVFAPGNNYPGEGMLVYPGTQAGLVGAAPSMRLKWMRDGVDDYDFVQLLRNAGRGAWAEQITRTVAPDWTNWTRDPSAIEAARRALGDAIEQLQPPRSATNVRILR